MQKTFRQALAIFTVCCAIPAFAQTDVQTPAEPTAQVQTVEQTTEQAKVQNVNMVNLNTATAAEIQDKLVGIGAKKAQAIVEYREKHGKFISIEQVTEVSGIGKATLDKNRDRIVIE